MADDAMARRGKALEYFSRHYGKVYVDEGRTISVREALIGIRARMQRLPATDKCITCGSSVNPTFKFCPECGEKLAKVSFCTECGAEQKGGAKFCSECGHKM